MPQKVYHLGIIGNKLYNLPKDAFHNFALYESNGLSPARQKGEPMTSLPDPDEQIHDTVQPTFSSTIRLAYGPEALQFGELHLPENSDPSSQHPIVILIHGGFWRAFYGYT